MQIHTTRDGLETDYQELSFMKVGKTPVEELAEMYWGEVSNSVTVKYNDTLYLCDGVSPTTGKWLTVEDITELRKYFQEVAIL